MIKRISFVWKKPDLSDAEFRRRWLGEHVAYAKLLPGVREYMIDFVTEGSKDGPQGIATLRFDSKEALKAAFRLPGLRETLLQTRELFAERVEVMIVDEYIVVPRTREL